jgi:hypothetical protein
LNDDLNKSVLFLPNNRRLNVMHIFKVRTKRKTRNYVSYFIFLILLIINSCEPLDNSDDVRDNFVGTWSASEESNNYEVKITKSSSDTSKIFIDNFNNMGDGTSVYAKVNGRNITIPSQDMDGSTVWGNGSITSNYKTITLTYSVKTGSETVNITAKYIK